jgi:hypothetical protein
MLELDGTSIIRYSKLKNSDLDEDIEALKLAGSPVIRDWMISGVNEQDGQRHSAGLSVDPPILASEYPDAQCPNRSILFATIVRRSRFSVFRCQMQFGGEGQRGTHRSYT